MGAFPKIRAGVSIAAFAALLAGWVVLPTIVSASHLVEGLLNMLGLQHPGKPTYVAAVVVVRVLYASIPIWLVVAIRFCRVSEDGR